ncbi:MAG: biopolymer transporter ExbD [Gammaproteobacteria bacterium]|nr:biopolymer transporter ExbD [Gammaproteobacteria bacterium]
MRFSRSMESEEVSLDITPLIDVVFLMLIFFMVTTTFQKESELKVQLPRAQTQTQPEQGEKIDLLVTADGIFQVNGAQLVDDSEETLREALVRVANGNFQIPVVVRADRNASVQSMITAVNSAARAGLSKVAFATAEQAAQ